MIVRVIEAEVDGQTRACLVTTLYDINGKKTTDFDKATAAVVKISDGAYIDIDPTQTPVYTVN